MLYSQLQSCDVTSHAFSRSRSSALRLSIFGAPRRSRILKMLRSYAGGLFYCLALYSCAFFGCIFLMGPTMPLLWLRPQWFRWVNDRLISSWLLLPPVRKTLLEHCSWCFYSPNYLLSDFSSRHLIRIVYVR